MNLLMDTPPEAALAITTVPSPNHGERRGLSHPDMIVLHYTGMLDAADALRRLCSLSSQVSAHYLVFADGRIVQCVPEERRAWHAGASRWSDIEDVNSHSVGIEIANPGHDYGYPDFPAPQVDAVIVLCRDIALRHGIIPERILAHSDVAPLRKQDPGEKFPWAHLHECGVGHWVEPAPLGLPGPTLARNDSGSAVIDLQSALQRYGYGLEVTGAYDELTEAVVRAFQRHFRPARVDGIADASTRRTLDDLLAQSAAQPLV